MKNHIDHLLGMRTSLVKNYGLPGVDSSLISNGIVRIFESHREQQESITPHSHKFDFCCLVLSGKVLNRTWYADTKGDPFIVSYCQYLGEIGKYEKEPAGEVNFSFVDKTYVAGEWYGMKHDEIHSIYFSKGCKVLFFEGEVITNETRIIEPCVDGKHLQTFEIKKWMFERQS
jgi:hypothetical protein